eukprot:EG_transcript_17474
MLLQPPPIGHTPAQSTCETFILWTVQTTIRCQPDVPASAYLLSSSLIPFASPGTPHGLAIARDRAPGRSASLCATSAQRLLCGAGERPPSNKTATSPLVCSAVCCGPSGRRVRHPSPPRNWGTPHPSL